MAYKVHYTGYGLIPSHVSAHLTKEIAHTFALVLLRKFTEKEAYWTSSDQLVWHDSKGGDKVIAWLDKCSVLELDVNLDEPDIRWLYQKEVYENVLRWLFRMLGGFKLRNKYYRYKSLQNLRRMEV